MIGRGDNIKTKKVAIIGAGNRGKDVYAKLIKENKNLEVNAIAEPQKLRRDKFAQENNIPPNLQFKSWEDLLIEGRLADGIIVATGDKLHFKPLTKFLEKGYKILCEKPITDQYHELKQLEKKYYKYSNKVMVAHVLRYTPFFNKIKEIIKSKIIGKVRFINLIENIGYFHYAHSYVRGNWRNKKVAAPIILAKSCHDLDILYWLLDSRYKRIYSEISEKYFNHEHQPSQVAQRCIDCVIEDNCPYSAKKVYLNKGYQWPISTITEELSQAGIKKALAKSNYGRCVYRVDNDQPDVYSALLKFNNEVTAHFTLTAFSKEMTRKINIFATHGEISGDLKAGQIVLKPFLGKNKKIEIDIDGAHAGGDRKLINSFAALLLQDDFNNQSNLLSSLESHYAALALEKARYDKSPIELNLFRRRNI